MGEQEPVSKELMVLQEMLNNPAMLKSYFNQPEEEVKVGTIDFIRVLKDILSYWKLMLLSGGVVFVVSMILLYFLVELKFETSILLLIKNDASVTSIGDGKNSIPIQQYNVSTLANTIATIPNIQSVIAMLGIKTSAWDLAKKIEIETNRQSETIKIKVVDTLPDRAAAIANALGEVAIQANTRMYATEAANFIKIFDQKAMEEKEKLEQIDQQIIQFSNNNNLVNIDADMSAYNQRLTLMETRQDEAMLALNENAVRQASLEKSWSTDPEKLINDPQFEDPQAKQRIRNVEEQLNDALSRFTDQHPRVVQLRAELASLRKEVQESVYRKAKVSLANNQSTLRASLGQIRQAVGGLNQRVSGLPKKNLEINQLLQEKEAIQQRYVHFIKVMEEARLIKEGLATNMQIASYAVVPEYKKKKIFDPIKTAVSLSLALGTALFISVVMMLFNYRIKTKKELQLLCPYPVLVEQIRLKEGDVVNPADSAYYNLLSQISGDRDGVTALKLAFTSTYPSEGKTTLCMALSRFYTVYSSRCLFLDFNPDSDTYSKFGGTSDSTQISLYEVTRKPDLDFVKTIRETTINGLYYMKVGNSWKEYQATVDAISLDEIISQLSLNFDFIFIDLPAVLEAAVLPIAGNMLEHLFYTVESNRLKKRALDHAFNRLEMSRIKPEGILLNKLNKYYIGDVFHEEK